MFPESRSSVRSWRMSLIIVFGALRVEQLLSARYPPYTKEHFDIMAADAFIHIHEEANPSVLSVPKS